MKRDSETALLDSAGPGNTKQPRGDEFGGDEFGGVDPFGEVEFGEADFNEAEVLSSEPPEEKARREFAERLHDARTVKAEELPELLAVLRDKAPAWGTTRYAHSVALLLVHVSRSARTCRAAFVASGLPMLGSVLQEAIGDLEASDAAVRQDGAMRVHACLVCLRALPIGRATMWAHRKELGHPFDKLHKWCAKGKSALAAELRGPTQALCKRWRQQPKPALQEASVEQKAVRMKVVEMISQGLNGIAGHSPASPAGLTSPGMLPPTLTANEVEAALFGRFGGATPEYRQHARMLRSNLAAHGNAHLRERVLSGELPAEQLVAMDSDSLAPDALQAERKKQHADSIKEVTYQNMVSLRRLASESEDRNAYNSGTAPPLMVFETDIGDDGKLKDTAEEKGAKEVAALRKAMGKPALSNMEPPPTPFMAPPPTPFRPGAATHMAEGAGTSGTADGSGTPDMMPTPALDEEDEEASALMRFLSQPV